MRPLGVPHVVRPGTTVEGMCPHCGAPNPPGNEVCQYCRGPLPLPAPVEPPSSVPAPWTSSPEEMELQESDSWIYANRLPVSAAVTIVLGILLLVGAGAIHQQTQNFNSNCSHNPTCIPESDNSLEFTAAGLFCLAFGGILGLAAWVQFYRDTADE